MAALESKPLQAMCIKTIVENFDRFSNAYNPQEALDVPRRKLDFLQPLCQCIPYPFKKYLPAERIPPPIYIHYGTLPKKYFEFLQRTYSDVLLTKLRRCGKLKDEHVPLLINQYIGDLNLKDFKRCTRTVVEKQIQIIGDTLVKLVACRYFCDCSRRREGGCDSHPKLQPEGPDSWVKSPYHIDISEDNCRNYLIEPESLTIHCPVMRKSCSHEKKLTNDSLKTMIMDCRNLEVLVLAGTFCCDDTMRVIGMSCPGLKSLDVSFCPGVTDLGLRSLFAVQEDEFVTLCDLKVINIKETGIKDEGIVFLLKNMKSLEVLKHERLEKILLSIYIKDHKEQKSLETFNLTYLDIQMSNLTTAELYVHVILCPKLKRLTLSSFTESDLKVCTNLKYLENVKLIGDYVTSLDDFLKAKGPQITNLDLLHCSISAEILTKYCPNLKSLSLFSVTFKDSAEYSIGPLNSLVSFSEYISDATDDLTTTKSTSALLKVCPKLEILRLVACAEVCPGINDAILNCVARLKKKDFRYSNVQLSLLDSTLLRSSTLQKVDVRSSKEVFDWTDNLLDMLRLTKSPVDVHWGYFVSRYTNSMV